MCPVTRPSQTRRGVVATDVTSSSPVVTCPNGPPGRPPEADPSTPLVEGIGLRPVETWYTRTRHPPDIRLVSYSVKPSETDPVGSPVSDEGLPSPLHLKGKAGSPGTSCSSSSSSDTGKETLNRRKRNDSLPISTESYLSVLSFCSIRKVGK